MTDLFNWTNNHYPHSPGAKEHNGTSQAAATIIMSKVSDGQRRVLGALRHKDMTADEVAAELRESILFIRPRLSECFRLGVVEKTSLRRRNVSGLMATVWRLVDGGSR